MNSATVFEYLAEKIGAAMEAEYATWKIKGVKGNSLKNYGLKHTKRFPASETVLLQLVRNAVCYGKDKLLLSSEDGNTLYCYNGKYFEVVEVRADKFVKELVRRVFRALGIGMAYQTDVASIIARECVETLTSSDEYLYVPEHRYIAFDNGIFDVQSGRLKVFDVKYKPYIALDIPYSPAKDLYIEYDKKYGSKREVNPAKLWEWKIGEIIPNKDMRDAFQMFCGSLLLDREKDAKIEYVCYLIGSGSNGKSVLASAIAGVFGEKYFSRFTPRQLFKDSDARVNIAALQGKIANLVGDLDEAEIAGGDFKRFASGEKFQGRRNYKDPIQVVAPPLLVCTNAMPETSDDSWGHHRRQLPIHTTLHQFTDEDKDPYLTQKLTTPEARAWIFTWIYEGYKTIMRNGGNVVLGKDVQKAQRILQDRSSSMRMWWSDNQYQIVENPTEKDPRWRPLKDLYKEYCAYAEENGFESKKKNKEVAAMIRSKGASEDSGNERRTSDGTCFCVERIS